MLNLTLTLMLSLMPACAYEDETNCGWNAATQGNGQGVSFVSIAGRTFMLEAI